jgi:hypothetical protein
MSERRRDDRSAVLRSLANGQRRSLLRYLDGRDGSASRAEVVEHLSNGGHDTADEEHVSANLHHVHLPKLAAADVVVVDPDRGTIDEGPAFAFARGLLEHVE